MFSKSVVKYIQSLQQKKFRDLHQAFVAEGPKVVGELISDGIFRCRNVYATEGWQHPGLSKDTTVTIVKDHELEKLASYSTPNQVVAEFELRTFSMPGDFKSMTLILDDIRDPGNLGTIIRTADWFQIEYIICSGTTVDIYNPKVIQSTMASLGRVKIVYTDIEDFVLRHKDNCIAAAIDGEPPGNFPAPFTGFVIIGNESSGVRKQILELVRKVSIPGEGKAESLNAAVAAGILMYALK